MGSPGCPQAGLIPCVDGAPRQPAGVGVSERGQDPGASWGQSSIACSMLNATVVCGFTSAPQFSPLTQCFLSDTSEQSLVAPKKKEIGSPPGDPPFPGRFRNPGGDGRQEGKPTLPRKRQHLALLTTSAASFTHFTWEEMKPSPAEVP